MPKSQFSDAYSSFVSVLVAARRDAGLTQTELARRVGRDQPFISLVEKGVRRVDLVEFYALAVAMDHDPKELFGRIADALPPKPEI